MVWLSSLAVAQPWRRLCDGAGTSCFTGSGSESEFKADPVVDIYTVASELTQSAAMRLAEQVRDALPGVKLMTNHGGGNFKKQFARADKWGARVALVLGESEIADGNVVVKDLRSGEQTTVTQDSVAAHLRTLLG